MSEDAGASAGATGTPGVTGGATGMGPKLAGEAAASTPTAGMVPDGESGDQSQMKFRYREEWLNQLPPDMQSLVAKYDYDLSKTLKAHLSAEEALSKRNEQFSDNDWETYHSYEERVHGVPKTPDGYEFKFEKLSEHSQPVLHENFTKALQGVAHDLSLSKKQAQGLFSFLNEVSSQAAAEYDATTKEAQVNAYNHLKKEWRNGFQENIGYAERAFHDILPKMGVNPNALQNEFANLDLKFFPEIMKTLAAVGRAFSSSPRRGYNNMTPSDAMVELQQFKENREMMDAFTSRSHKNHQKALDMFYRLSEKANGIR
jgi:hypothetical protein